MKKCQYCGTVYKDTKTNCPKCSSNEAYHICNNCGEVFNSGFCPSCGVRAGDQPKVCPKCNKKYFSAACPDCGYKIAPNPPINNTPFVPQSYSFSEYWRILLISVILGPSIGSYIIAFSPKMPRAWKIGVGIWLLLLPIIVIPIIVITKIENITFVKCLAFVPSIVGAVLCLIKGFRMTKSK